MDFGGRFGSCWAFGKVWHSMEADRSGNETKNLKSNKKSIFWAFVENCWAKKENL